MSNDAHMKILYDAIHQGNIAIWNEWRASHPEIIPDLFHADLRHADLFGANLNDADLRGANLYGAEMSSATFIEADLSHATLIEADLSAAILSRAHLYQVDMSKADIREADLYEADLTEANLSHANLSGASMNRSVLNAADLIGSDLRGVDMSRAVVDSANFAEATFGATTIGAVDLSKAKGLDTAIHDEPSTIGVDSLYQSRGIIPEAFLRGCGMADNMITFVSSLVTSAIDYYNCFISYSLADEDFAKLLLDTLQGAGIRVWLAPDHIMPSQDESAALDRGIRYWDKVLFCASEHSLRSDWWREFERDETFQKTRNQKRIRGVNIGELLPLNVDGYLMSETYQLRRHRLNGIATADFVGWENDFIIFKQEAKRVIRAIRSDYSLLA